MASQRRLPLQLSVQTVLPADWASSKPFRSTVEGLRDLGLWGVELNVADLEDMRTADVLRIEEYLARFGIALSMFASGLTAKNLGVSLSAVDDSERRRAVLETGRMIDWTAAGNRPIGDAQPTGIIIGFLKGGVAEEPERARRSLVLSLMELLPRADEKDVPLILEATNRYESSVANTLADATAIIEEALDASNLSAVRKGRLLQILPDTFHMNIEESDPPEALRAAADHYTSVHLSDNNRLFPGYGAFDFAGLFTSLDALGYTGRFAIEGTLKNDLLSDLRESLQFLSPLMKERR